MRRVILRSCLILAVTLVMSLSNGYAVYACWGNETSCSSTYGVSETFFGNGGSLCDPNSPGVGNVNYVHSPSYCAKTAIGEKTVGNAVGSAYQTQAGFNSDREPSLTLLVNNSNCQDYQAGGVVISLPNLSSGSAVTTNANFSVQSYLASSYNVTTVGSAPKSNGPVPHTMTALSAGGGSSPGTEQFGINLVANTTPISFGHAPQYLPNSTFSFGSPAAGYGTANSYKYNNGDSIATSSKSSGTTCYAMSYIFNISNLTPAGTYTMNQSIVVTSSF